MMWDVVIPAWVALLENDAQLISELGGDHIYPAQASRPVRIPSVEWLAVYDRESELFNPILIQVDYWAEGVRQAAVIEKRIRRVTHRDVARRLNLDEYNTLYLWTRYLDSRTHDYPARQGVVAKSLDFQFEPLRARFQST